VKLLDYPDADVVLQSSDFHDFRVQKAFLVKHSSVLPYLTGSCKPLPIFLTLHTLFMLGELFRSCAFLKEARSFTNYNLLIFLLPMAPALPPNITRRPPGLFRPASGPRVRSHYLHASCLDYFVLTAQMDIPTAENLPLFSNNALFLLCGYFTR
jgi:hypothetical protein